jgi:hypothetical protein
MATEILTCDNRNFHVEADIDDVKKAIDETAGDGYFAMKHHDGGRILISTKFVVALMEHIKKDTSFGLRTK